MGKMGDADSGLDGLTLSGACGSKNLFVSKLGFGVSGLGF